MRQETFGRAPGARAGGPDAADPATHNLDKARFLTRLAWTIEIVLVLTGLCIALAQYLSVGAGAGALTGVSVAGVFVIIAAAELAKIPAAVVAFHARGWWRLPPAAALVVISAISFHTVFNGFERFAHATTAPVAAARLHLDELDDRIKGLSAVALEPEMDTAPIVEADNLQRKNLIMERDNARAAYEAERNRGASFETQELRKERDVILQQQSTAAESAADRWDKQQASYIGRLNDPGTNEETRAQLNAAMRAMSTRDSAIEGAETEFDASIAALNDRIASSLSEPSPEQLARLEDAWQQLAKAEQNLEDFNTKAQANLRNHTTRELERIAAAEERSARTETLEVERADAAAALTRAAAASQMHRWASFVFRRDPAQVTEAETKQVAAVFGAGLAIAAALAGSITAVFAEWFRVRGVRPVTVEVPVETRVEVEVPVEVKVPVEVDRFVYVPFPAGPGTDDIIAGILAELPPKLAAQLRAELDGAAPPSAETAV